ncbi:MAG: hypothetical protein MUE49_07655 [Rhodospirillales bacterium]|jgi:hypothetical protein|nr:hypothetical protein [Rhodospirillales bacterium]
MRAGEWSQIATSLAALAVAVSGFGGAAAAAEYYARAALQQSLGYDDNPNFSVDDTRGSGASITSTSGLSLNAGAQTPAFQFDTNAVLSYDIFPDNTELNSFDQQIGASVARRFGQSRYGVQGSFLSDTTRTSDVEETGRFVDTNSRRYVWSAGPFMQTQIDPLNSASLSATYSNQDRVSQNLPDSEQYSANAQWTHILTPRTQAQAGLNGFIYNSNSSGSNESESIGATFGVLHQVSQRLSVRFLAGPVYTIQRIRGKQSFINEFGLPESDTNNRSSSLSYQIDSGATYQLSERTDFGATFTRTASPDTTSGVVTESNRVAFSANHDILRTVSVGTALIYNRRTNLASGGGGDDDVRDLVEIGPNVTWKVDNDLWLSLNYRFRWQREDDTGSTATSNGVFFALNYDLPRLLGNR